MSLTRNQRWWVMSIVVTLVLVNLGVYFLMNRTSAPHAQSAPIEVPVEPLAQVAVSEYKSLFGDNIPESTRKKIFPNAGKPVRGTIKREVATSSESAVTTVVKVKSVMPATSATTYVVKKGDWLSTICPSDWPAVAELNKLYDANHIEAGWKLELTEKCNEVEFVAHRGSTKTTLVVAKPKVVKAVVPVKVEVPAPIRKEKASEEIVAAPVQPATVQASGKVLGVHKGEDGLQYCDVDLPQGEKAFQWRQPGLNPIGDEDPREYLETLAASEGLPNEAREYFLAELRKGELGDFVQTDLRYCQYLGAMVGKKVHNRIVVHRHTVLNWPIEVYKRKHSVFGKRKQTDDEMRMNGTARRYVFVIGKDRWVLYRANVCGNLILRREEVAPPPATVTAPQEPEPTPIPSSPRITGTCVPRSRPQDCAMPGCVLRVPLPDATLACAASCESAPKMNFDSLGSAKGMHPVVDGTCPLSDARPDAEPLATFTVLGGAYINETDPVKICQMTPDVEYRGLQLVCLADGTVRRGE